jgi:protein-disulfide isomerase/uncharacterized membrane protein
MKKYLNTLETLSFLGMLVSGFLLLDHYYPELNTGLLSCGDGFKSSCFAVSQSAYATLFGVPLASYGLFFYAFTLFTLLVADYAAGRYTAYAVAILLPLAALAVLADIALGLLLIVMKELCLPCVATYAVNIAMLAALALWQRRARKEGGDPITDIIKSMARDEGTPDRRASFALYVLFGFLLLFAIFSTSHILKSRTGAPAPSPAEIRAQVDEFYAAAPEDLRLPGSGMVLGDPKGKVQVIAFTDFLCGACYQLFRAEKHLFSRFGDDITVTYYNYPLDRSCNAGLQGTKYPGSCDAARAFIAAASLGKFREYLAAHFTRYGSFRNGYDTGTARKIAARIADMHLFDAASTSPETAALLKRDIALANGLGVTATPTLFINGRRLVGVPSKEVFEAIIEKELKVAAHP